jgi:AraC-like DNA-binding protein
MSSVTLDWLHVVALLGALQGLLLTAVLATKRTNRLANRLLAVAMFAFSLHLASAVYLAAGYERVFPHFFGIAYPLPFLYGPLVYLYAVTAADRTRRLRWRDALHLVPFAAAVLLGLPVYLMSGEAKLGFYDDIRAGIRPGWLDVADPAKLVSGVVYATATVVFLVRHRDQVKASYSSLEHVNLTWLLWLGGAAAGIWSIAVVAELLGKSGDNYVVLALAVLVYAIGYLGLRQPEIFRFEVAQSPSADQPAPRYERSGLSDREAERLRDALTATMDRDRLWRNSNLTLADLAARLDTTPHRLSEVLNGQLGQTFYDFVNGYRVRDVQNQLALESARNMKLLSLALDAGFASKSTFNEVFKKHTGTTPSDYRRTLDE